MSSDIKYHPLLTDPATEHLEKISEDGEPVVRAPPPCRMLVWAALGLQSLVIVFLVAALFKKTSQECLVRPSMSPILYSPAQDVLDYEPRTFASGFDKPTIYQGDPSPEVDHAWEALYNEFGISQIPKSQARLLPNKTLPIPGHEDQYAVGLAVFHQLHCLNLIRKGFRPDYYTDPVTGAIAGVEPEEWDVHLSHCIDNLRQSIMCASDISSIVWQWDEAIQKTTIRMDTVHSCRNFDKIVDWAQDHRRTHAFNFSVHIEDDIEIPTIWHP